MENATDLSILTAAGIGQSFFALGVASAVPRATGSQVGGRRGRSACPAPCRTLG